MQKLFLPIDDLKVEVTIVSERNLFGRHEVEVVPVSGSGTRWVWFDRLLRLDPKIKEKTK